MSDLREVLIEALAEWGLSEDAERSVMRDRLLRDDVCVDAASAVAKVAGLNIDDEKDTRALLYLLCLFAFTDLPKGAKPKSWREDVPFIRQVAEAARQTEGVKLSSLVAKLWPDFRDARADAAHRQRIIRAHANVSSGLPSMTDEERLEIVADIDVLAKFVSAKHQRNEQVRRGAYSRK